ncbi:MAG: circadian clock KaiB family protein [bacterium]
MEKNKKSNVNKILLFISKDSIYFQVTMQEFQKLLKEFEKIQPFSSEIIDINKDPDMAEKYKIDALPTMIIGDKRFIGQPSAEKIMGIIKSEKK